MPAEAGAAPAPDARGLSPAPTTFRDHFSQTSAAYAEFRPGYPATLFDWLASLAPARRLAWDAATGNGQAALPLAARFERVVATDASAEQLREATPHAHIEYRVARAEDGGLPDASVDLLTVAQSAHWFELPAFHAQAARALAPRGVVALWCYGLLAIEPGLDERLRAFYVEVVGPYWPPERRLVDEGYRGLSFPYDELAAPGFAMEHDLTLPALAGYLGTWSAVQAFRKERGSDPVEPCLRELEPAWGAADRPRRARWPLHLRVGRRRAADAG
ncbi:MAG TPA: class I SAM-dependent methyltransferase [Planctomycetota bacterium]|nr:class I SAM-dependent methyltransferase [Planctomycetota bacterium]